MLYNKYGAKRIKTEDGTFDSLKEYRRWCELKILQKAGEIKDLKRQKEYELIPKQEGERAVKYVADFVYYDNKLKAEIVEDTKGFKTDVYKIKKKLMLYKYGIRIKET